MRIRVIPVLCLCLAAGIRLANAQTSVQVDASKLEGPRVLAKQTERAAVRDYLQAWKSLSAAMNQNRVDLLDQDFVGIALDKLSATVRDQQRLGIRTAYQDLSHDVHLVFYSPEGLSIQLLDNVEYNVQLIDHDKVLTTQRAHARYVVVLTPSEVRWQVRIIQGDPQ